MRQRARIALLSLALVVLLILVYRAWPRRVPVPGIDALLAVKTPSGAAPRFPLECRRLGRVAFVAVPPLATLDVGALAERYRRVYGLDVEVLRPLAEENVNRTFDIDREQYDGARLALEVASSFPVTTPPRWIIGITDGDMFWPGRNWRFAFSMGIQTAAVVSTAHTEQGRERSAERTMKLISRLLAETYCGLQRGSRKDSLLAPTLLSLDDLDAVDESVWAAR